jgi:hypothetical protein
MTPPPNDNLLRILAVSALPTATATPVPAAADARPSRPWPAGRRPTSSKLSARPSAVTTAVVPDRSQFREQRLLFAHAGRRTISSRTRGFVQHVV